MRPPTARHFRYARTIQYEEDLVQGLHKRVMPVDQFEDRCSRGSSLGNRVLATLARYCWQREDPSMARYRQVNRMHDYDCPTHADFYVSPPPYTRADRSPERIRRADGTSAIRRESIPNYRTDRRPSPVRHDQGRPMRRIASASGRPPRSDQP